MKLSAKTVGKSIIQRRLWTTQKFETQQSSRRIYSAFECQHTCWSCGFRNQENKWNWIVTKSLRDELSKYSFQQPEERSFEFTSIKSMYDGFLKNGDLVKFFRNIMQQFLWSLHSSSLDCQGMLPHYCQLKLPTASLHIVREARTLVTIIPPLQYYLRGKGLACNT